MKREASVLRAGEHPVEHEYVDVNVQIERAPKSLHDGHRTTTRIHETARTSPVPQVAVHLAEQHADDGLAQVVVPGQ